MMCKNNEHMCKNFYKYVDHSIIFMYILREIWGDILNVPWCRRPPQQILKSSGTMQPISAVEIEVYWLSKMSTKYCRSNAPGYKEDIDRGRHSSPAAARWCQCQGSEGRGLGQVARCTFHPRGSCYSLFWGLQMIEIFLIFLKNKFCIYQYFIIFPQWTILHQKFLRRKKLGRPKREVKIKSGGTWEEEVTSSAGGHGVLGGRERTWRWGDPSMAIAEGLVERWALEVSLGHHTFPEHRGLRAEQWGRTVCARHCSKHLT